MSVLVTPTGCSARRREHQPTRLCCEIGTDGGYRKVGNIIQIMDAYECISQIHEVKSGLFHFTRRSRVKGKSHNITSSDYILRQRTNKIHSILFYTSRIIESCHLTFFVFVTISAKLTKSAKRKLVHTTL